MSFVITGFLIGYIRAYNIFASLQFNFHDTILFNLQYKNLPTVYFHLAPPTFCAVIITHFAYVINPMLHCYYFCLVNCFLKTLKQLGKHLPIYLSFLVLFLSLCRSVLASGIIFLLPKGIFLVVWVCH